MSIGVLVRDAAGRVVMDPDTFTVRLIAVVDGPGGDYRSVVRVACPSARNGMFAVAIPRGDWESDRMGYTSGVRPQQNQGNISVGPRMPGVQVVDGFIELFPPSGSGLFTGGMQLFLYSSV